MVSRALARACSALVGRSRSVRVSRSVTGSILLARCGLVGLGPRLGLPLLGDGALDLGAAGGLAVAQEREDVPVLGLGCCHSGVQGVQVGAHLDDGGVS
jgi:hypothetical protein